MTPLVTKYCKKCLYASWDDNSVVVCDHQDVYDECWKANVEDSPPRVHDAVEISCRGEYFVDREDLYNEIK